MEIKLNKYYKEEIGKIAEQYGVMADLLEDTYKEIMISNFYQDVCDIARENEEDLKVKE